MYTHTPAHIRIYIYVGVYSTCVVLIMCAIFVCTVIPQLLRLLLQKEAAHNYKFHSEEHKEKAAVDGSIEKTPYL